MMIRARQRDGQGVGKRPARPSPNFARQIASAQSSTTERLRTYANGKGCDQDHGGGTCDGEREQGGRKNVSVLHPQLIGAESGRICGWPAAGVGGGDIEKTGLQTIYCRVGTKRSGAVVGDDGVRSSKATCGRAHPGLPMSRTNELPVIPADAATYSFIAPRGLPGTARCFNASSPALRPASNGRNQSTGVFYL